VIQSAGRVLAEVKMNLNTVQKLYTIPRNSRIRVVEEGYEHQELDFYHIDGMYSFCLTHDDPPRVVHLPATCEVELIESNCI
jgi:hypothetical protein